jgi:hypothetical protein
MSSTDDPDFGSRVGAGEAGSPDDDEAPEFSDEDLALRFAGQFVYTVRYVAAMGRWFLWTGKVWAEDEKRSAFSLSRQVIRAAARECRKGAKSIASAKTVAAVERLAQADPSAFCIWLYPYPALLRYVAHSAGGYWARILPQASEIAS